MSKKSNKKSAKKKVSKKPAKKKNNAKAGKKKPAKKAPKAKKKAAPKKSKAKKPVKKVKKAVKKKVVKKAAPKKTAKKVIAKPAKKAAKEIKKPAVKVVAPVSKPVVNKPVEQKIEAPKKEKVVKVVKRVVRTPVTPPKKTATIDIKTGPEPAGRFELEYVVHASSQILFEFLTTPSGLSEWFCDDVNIRNGVYSFKWEENEQNARVVRLIEEKTVRFQWVDKTDNSYFEFRIERDDLTNDISLIIADFAETPEEKASSTLLWNSQIDKLLHVLGAYF